MQCGVRRCAMTYRRSGRRLLALSVGAAIAVAPVVAAPASHASPDIGTAVSITRADVIAHSASRKQRKLADQAAQAVLARLSIMPTVAWSKWATKSAVDDPARNVTVVEAFVDATRNAHVPKRIARQISRDQIAAAISVQNSLITIWSFGLAPAPVGPAPNLATQVRPQIDAATAALAKAVKQIGRHADSKTWVKRAQAAEKRILPKLPEGISAAMYRQAFEEITYWFE